jgi:alpha-galactosidase
MERPVALLLPTVCLAVLALPTVLRAEALTTQGSPAAEHLRTIDRIVRRDWPVGLYWIDAEWFGGTPWYSYPGNWEVRKDLYPQGLRPISDALHPSGRKLLLWFEPQRVCQGTPWAQFRDRPGWLLELKGGNPEYQQHKMNWGVPHDDPRWIERESHRSQICEGDMLWNMGQPDARRFLTDWLSARIAEFGLDWYREDFNIAPLEYWQEADAPDRQGMTEIRYVEGLYALWDELLRRHPHLAIDNCASGGRRIDLETIGRATALWRTDWPADAIHRQCHTFGLLPDTIDKVARPS